MILFKTLFLGQAVDASMLSLPLLAGMTDKDVKDVTKAVWERLRPENGRPQTPEKNKKRERTRGGRKETAPQ
jgi:hypothetical protein